MFGRLKKLEKRVAELERLQQGGCDHDWYIFWIGETGTRHVEKCRKPNCDAWRGSI